MSPHDAMRDYVAARTTAPAPLPARRRGISGRQLAGVALAGALIGAWISPGRAYADPVPATPDGVHVVKLGAGPVGPRIAVTLSNGARDILAPCRYEDGRACYWDGGEMGNGVGRSFVVTRGRVFTVDAGELFAAAVTR